MSLKIWVATLSLLVASGCGKSIGDSCKSVNECITTDTNRLCLTQDGEGFPGGYCTKFNCGGSNACPEEAACVAYRYTLSGAGGGECSEVTGLSRLQRTYCMFRCDSNDDCRDGYVCLSADGENPLGATIIDQHAGAKICTLAYDQPANPPERESEVCEAEGLRSEEQLPDSGTSSGAGPSSEPTTHSAVSSAPDAASPAVSLDAAAATSSAQSTTGPLVDAAVNSSDANVNTAPPVTEAGVGLAPSDAAPVDAAADARP